MLLFLHTSKGNGGMRHKAPSRSVYIEREAPSLEKFQTRPSGQMRPRRLEDSSGGPRGTAL